MNTHDQPTPADEAMTAKHRSQIKFMSNLLDSFKGFVLDAMDTGIHKDFEDHMVFFSVCANEFKSMTEEE